MQRQKAKTISDIRFAKNFWDALPGERDGALHLSRMTPEVCFAAAWPEPTIAPNLLAWSASCARELGLPEELSEADQLRTAHMFSGHSLPVGTQPYAMRYGGHQFGNWAGQLGDGRVINLGEVCDAAGRWQTVQLKGAGPTPYSRAADGRAVLRSSIREFVASEAMAHLGVPTSRALALVTTGHEVMRDLLYDGNARLEPGAVTTRVAPSFLRLGNFEIHAAFQEGEALDNLLQFALQEYFPQVKGSALAMYAEVCESTAELMAHWMSVGFVHGVMNTDNLSLLGLTIDYGPFGFLDQFDPSWTPNEVDQTGRYAYANQPRVAQWNLSRFGSALARVGVGVADLESVLQNFHHAYNTAFRRRMSAKLGLVKIRNEDGAWLEGVFTWMSRLKADWTIVFRGLAECLRANNSDERFVRLLKQSTYQSEWDESTDFESARAWFSEWKSKLATRAVCQESHAVAAAMDANNPVVIPRNWILGNVIEHAEAGRSQPLHDLLHQLQTPFSGDFDACLHGKRPDWAIQRPGCGRLTCSS